MSQSHGVGHEPFCRVAQHPLGDAIVDLLLVGHRHAEFDQVVVEERNARLDRMRHGVAIAVTQEPRDAVRDAAVKITFEHVAGRPVVVGVAPAHHVGVSHHGLAKFV